MQMNTFGNTGLEVSRLGFGGAPIGYLDTDVQQVAKILNFLLDSGVNFVDTAANYPGSEEAIGKALGHRRDDVVLVSKCGQAFDDLKGEPWSETVITQTIDRSLSRLRTDHLDVMLLHTCELDVLQKGEALGALVKAKEAGKIRFAGYSGDNEEAAWAAQQPDVDVIETSINIADQHNIDHVLPVCRKRNLGVIAKRPIANAAWREPEQQRGIYKNYAASYRDRIAAMKVTPLELGYSGHPEVEWPEIALKFTLAQPGVHVAITGTTSQTNAKINVQAVKKNPLREQVVDRLRQAFKKAEAESGETWRGLG